MPFSARVAMTIGHNHWLARRGYGATTAIVLPRVGFRFAVHLVLPSSCKVVAGNGWSSYRYPQKLFPHSYRLSCSKADLSSLSNLGNVGLHYPTTISWRLAIADLMKVFRCVPLCTVTTGRESGPALANLHPSRHLTECSVISFAWIAEMRKALSGH